MQSVCPQLQSVNAHFKQCALPYIPRTWEVWQVVLHEYSKEIRNETNTASSIQHHVSKICDESYAKKVPQ